MPEFLLGFLFIRSPSPSVAETYNWFNALIAGAITTCSLNALGLAKRLYVCIPVMDAKCWDDRVIKADLEIGRPSSGRCPTDQAYAVEQFFNNHAFLALSDLSRHDTVFRTFVPVQGDNHSCQPMVLLRTEQLQKVFRKLKKVSKEVESLEPWILDADPADAFTFIPTWISSRLTSSTLEIRRRVVAAAGLRWLLPWPLRDELFSIATAFARAEAAAQGKHHNRRRLGRNTNTSADSQL